MVKPGTLPYLLGVLGGTEPVPSTRYLSLCGIPGLSDRDIQAIADGIASNAGDITGLKLEDCKITCQQVKVFSRALDTNAVLELLELRGNSIGADGANALLETLRVKNCTLKCVDLIDNPCITQAPDVIHELEQKLQRNGIIKKLPKTPRSTGVHLGSTTPSVHTAVDGPAITTGSGFHTPMSTAHFMPAGTPGRVLDMDGFQFQVEKRLQQLEGARNLMMSELEHVRSFSSTCENWQRKIDVAGQQIATILSGVDQTYLTLEQRLEGVESWRDSADAASLGVSKVIEHLAKQLQMLQGRVQALEERVLVQERPKVSNPTSPSPRKLGAMPASQRVWASGGSYSAAYARMDGPRVAAPQEPEQQRRLSDVEQQLQQLVGRLAQLEVQAHVEVQATAGAAAELPTAGDGPVLAAGASARTTCSGASVEITLPVSPTKMFLEHQDNMRASLSAANAAELRATGTKHSTLTVTPNQDMPDVACSRDEMGAASVGSLSPVGSPNTTPAKPVGRRAPCLEQQQSGALYGAEMLNSPIMWHDNTSIFAGSPHSSGVVATPTPGMVQMPGSNVPSMLVPQPTGSAAQTSSAALPATTTARAPPPPGPTFGIAAGGGPLGSICLVASAASHFEEAIARVEAAASTASAASMPAATAPSNLPFTFVGMGTPPAGRPPACSTPPPKGPPDDPDMVPLKSYRASNGGGRAGPQWSGGLQARQQVESGPAPSTPRSNITAALSPVPGIAFNTSVGRPSDSGRVPAASPSIRYTGSVSSSSSGGASTSLATEGVQPNNGPLDSRQVASTAQACCQQPLTPGVSIAKWAESPLTGCSNVPASTVDMTPISRQVEPTASEAISTMTFSQQTVATTPSGVGALASPLQPGSCAASCHVPGTSRRRLSAAKSPSARSPMADAAATQHAGTGIPSCRVDAAADSTPVSRAAPRPRPVVDEYDSNLDLDQSSVAKRARVRTTGGDAEAPVPPPSAAPHLVQHARLQQQNYSDGREPVRTSVALAALADHPELEEQPAMANALHLDSSGPYAHRGAAKAQAAAASKSAATANAEARKLGTSLQHRAQPVHSPSAPPQQYSRIAALKHGDRGQAAGPASHRAAFRQPFAPHRPHEAPSSKEAPAGSSSSEAHLHHQHHLTTTHHPVAGGLTPRHMRPAPSGHAAAPKLQVAGSLSARAASEVSAASTQGDATVVVMTPHASRSCNAKDVQDSDQGAAPLPAAEPSHKPSNYVAQLAGLKLGPVARASIGMGGNHAGVAAKHNAPVAANRNQARQKRWM